ncbi:MAG: zinc finger domain-containing protein, partial [Desulfovibrionaceae bacterium]|nr:zinc finger domain-containing protein [Desulfovibrionaceae bacterium]
AVGMFAGESGAASCGLVFNDARKFGRIFLGSRTELESWPSWSRLGPEPLTMGREAFAAALKGRRAIKAVLMDQTVLAGVGNIYADESLHAAGIRPDRPASEISTARRHRLHDELVRLLLLSIEECGSSIRDYQDADGNVGAFQNHFAAYGRGGQPCRRCGATLVRTVLGGRGTVYCPKCQK